MLKIGYLWIVVQLDLNCSNKKFSDRNNSVYTTERFFIKISIERNVNISNTLDFSDVY